MKTANEREENAGSIRYFEHIVNVVLSFCAHCTMHIHKTWKWQIVGAYGISYINIDRYSPNETELTTSTPSNCKCYALFVVHFIRCILHICTHWCLLFFFLAQIINKNALQMNDKDQLLQFKLSTSFQCVSSQMRQIQIRELAIMCDWMADRHEQWIYWNWKLMHRCGRISSILLI